MESNKIVVAIKEHWPLLLGGAVGLYVVFHYMGSGSSSNSSDVGALAALAQTSAAAAAQNQNYNLAQGQLAAASTAASNQAQVAMTSATGDLIGKIGTSIGSVIAAQSALPALAINQASASHQTALVAAAGVAAHGIDVLPDTFTALARNQAVSHDAMLPFASALVDMTDSISALGMGAFNGISTTTAPSTGAAASAAAAGAAANAAATGAKMSAISHVADAAGKIFGGGF